MATKEEISQLHGGGIPAQPVQHRRGRQQERHGASAGHARRPAPRRHGVGPDDDGAGRHRAVRGHPRHAGHHAARGDLEPEHQLPAPARGRTGPASAQCKLLRVGRTLVVGEVALYSEGSDDPVAHVVGTYAIPPSRAASGLTSARMLSHVFIGVADFERALAFYRALMPVLGIAGALLRRSGAPGPAGSRSPGPRPLFLIGKPYDGRAARCRQRPDGGAARRAPRHRRPRPCRGAGPRRALRGPARPAARSTTPHYYGAYFRDTEGNKLCVVCHAAPG